MKKSLLLIALLFIVGLAYSQESKPETVLSAPDTWGPEIFSFPLDFAPSINYQGFEDIRFAPGWSDTTANDYFTYTFVWYLDNDPKITTNKLTDHVKAYFGGLMTAVSERDDLPAVTASFAKQANGTYTGSVNTYDAFFKKKALALNIITETSHCIKSGKYVVWFKLSPKDLKAPLWKTFEAVKLKVDCDK
ncbi:MAG: hypothetical protein HEP71_06285 [Roseivirga sp.]|nr:hypothetical protein [Roseivirga sp.]